MPSADKFEAPQGNPLFEVQLRAITESLAGNGIVSGGDFEVTATANNLEVEVASGTMFYVGSEYDLGAAETHTLTGGDADFDRWDTVYFDTATGSSGVRQGTPEQYPVAPDIQGDEMFLAAVYVEQGATDVPGSRVLNWRGDITDADALRYADSTGEYSVENTAAALDELQEAAQVSAYPLAPATDLAVNAYPFANSDLANSTVVVNAGTALTTTNTGIGLGGSATLDVAGVTDSEIDSATTIARGKLDQNKVAASVSAATTTSDEEIIFADTSGGAFTLILASADAVEGNEIVVVDVGGAVEDNPLTVETEGSEGIDGGSSVLLETNYGAQVLASDGTDWYTAGGGTGGGGVTQGSVIADASGTVAAGESGVLHTTGIADGETFEVIQASLILADGQPVPTGLDLVIATLDNAGAATKRTELVVGDGSTAFHDETGDPLGSYENTSGGEQTVALLVDNGNFNSGTGSAQTISTGAVGEIS